MGTSATKSIPELLNLLSDKKQNAELAKEALKKIVSQSDVPLLVENLWSRNQAAQNRVLRILVNIGKKADLALPQYCIYLSKHFRNGEIQLFANWGIILLGTQALPKLDQMIRDRTVELQTVSFAIVYILKRRFEKKELCIQPIKQVITPIETASLIDLVFRIMAFHQDNMANHPVDYLEFDVNDYMDDPDAPWVEWTKYQPPNLYGQNFTSALSSLVEVSSVTPEVIRWAGEVLGDYEVLIGHCESKAKAALLNLCKLDLSVTSNLLHIIAKIHSPQLSAMAKADN
jgi:hypothetical protein